MREKQNILEGITLYVDQLHPTSYLRYNKPVVVVLCYICYKLLKDGDKACLINSNVGDFSAGGPALLITALPLEGWEHP